MLLNTIANINHQINEQINIISNHLNLFSTEEIEKFIYSISEYELIYNFIKDPKTFHGELANTNIYQLLIEYMTKINNTILNKHHQYKIINIKLGIFTDESNLCDSCNTQLIYNTTSKLCAACKCISDETDIRLKSTLEGRMNSFEKWMNKIQGNENPNIQKSILDGIRDKFYNMKFSDKTIESLMSLVERDYKKNIEII